MSVGLLPLLPVILKRALNRGDSVGLCEADDMVSNRLIIYIYLNITWKQTMHDGLFDTILQQKTITRVTDKGDERKKWATCKWT